MSQLKQGSPSSKPATASSCWLHPDTPQVGCGTCPPPSHKCIEHGDFHGNAYECPGCLKHMGRHKAHARIALARMMADMRKLTKRGEGPNLILCAQARVKMMEEVVEGMGFKDRLRVEGRPDFEWHKFQLHREAGAPPPAEGLPR